MTPEEKEYKEQQEGQQSPQSSMYDFDGFVNSYKSGDKPFVEALMTAYQKPEPRITPEQEKKARTASAITDSLTTLADILGHTHGVKIRDKKGEKTNTQQTNARIEALKDKYEQDMLRYNALQAGAIKDDFAAQLRASMGNHQQKAQLEAEARNEARRAANTKQKREWQLEDEERKIKQSRDQAEWEMENIYKPKLAETDKYNARNEYRRQATTAALKGNKNTFEISVPEGTAGAEYDQYTGRWFKRETISPERQQSIISNLPEGKARYIENNGLYREQNSIDAYGQTRTTEVPWSDADVVKYYLENDYKNISPEWRVPQTTQSQSRGTVRTQQQQQPRGNVR